MGVPLTTLLKAMTFLLEHATREGYVRLWNLRSHGISPATAHRACMALTSRGELMRAAYGIYRLPGEQRPLPKLERKPHVRKKKERPVQIAMTEATAPVFRTFSVTEVMSRASSPIYRAPRAPFTRVRKEPAPAFPESERPVVRRAYDESVTGDVPPPLTVEQRILAALAMQPGLTTIELSKAVYGVSRMDAEYEGLKLVVDVLYLGGQIDEDHDGTLSLPPHKEN